MKYLIEVNDKEDRGKELRVSNTDMDIILEYIPSTFYTIPIEEIEELLAHIKFEFQREAETN
jgi:hypothetical protein